MGRPSPPVPREARGVPALGKTRIPRGEALRRRVALLRWIGRGFPTATAGVAVGLVGLVAAIVVVLTQAAWPSIRRFGFAFLIGSDWDPVRNLYGAYPAIVGTLLTSGIALLIAIPVALGVAIFLSEVAPPWLRRPLANLVDLSAAVPSVVYGFWAFLVLVPLMANTIEPALARSTGAPLLFSGRILGLDYLSAGVVLAVMIIPTIS